MDRVDYLEIRRKYTRLGTPDLEKMVATLFKKRYEEHDIDYFEHHRIASAVLIRRQRDKTGPTFHMQNLVV